MLDEAGTYQFTSTCGNSIDITVNPIASGANIVYNNDLAIVESAPYNDGYTAFGRDLLYYF